MSHCLRDGGHRSNVNCMRDDLTIRDVILHPGLGIDLRFLGLASAIKPVLGSLRQNLPARARAAADG